MLQKPPKYIQPDARGRILLPEEFRQFPLFEVIAHDQGILLNPLNVVPAVAPTKTTGEKKSPWLQNEVKMYLQQKIFPHLQTFLDKNQYSEICAAGLFGSRSRNDALNVSDFDIALVVEKFPGFLRRQEISESLSDQLEPFLTELKSHGINGEFSFVFFSFNVPEKPPAIYYALSEDGQLIWQKKKTWQIFIDKINKLKKKNKVKSIGSGRRKTWINE